MDSMDIMMGVVRGITAVIGLIIVTGTLLSAIKAFVLPRGVRVWLVRFVFTIVRYAFRFKLKRATFTERDQIMALFAPLALVLMPVFLLSFVLIGYMFLFWSLDPQPIAEIFKLSGSSLLTLGYASVETIPHKILEFSEAMIGLILVALLVAYLPTMYAAFARREAQVALWEAWAGSPPTVYQMVSRAHRTGELGNLREVWLEWQTWFADLEESHTSLAPVVFFRSPKPDRSWITAAGNALDSAAFILSTVDIKPEPRAAFCIRTGFIALRHIAAYFEIPFNSDPQPDDPISISRYEYDVVCEKLEANGIALRADRELAWQNFAGWRVNYDAPLLALANATMAPYAEWISDRSIAKQTCT